MLEAARCMLMRGGTSKGAYFLTTDLPPERSVRDDLLLRLMGSPDPRQIDGIGGAHPLTSKVAVVGPSPTDDADVEYLFLQVGVDDALVSDSQNCGNILAGVGPFAVERGLVSPPDSDLAHVRIRMLNTGDLVVATFPAAGGLPLYEGSTAISGVPGTAAPVELRFEDIAGGSSGALLPTGRTVDEVAGVPVTMIDCGMPVVVLGADAVGVSGVEDCAELEANSELRTLLEKIRLEAGPLMNLGDVVAQTVPKLTMVSRPQAGGAIGTRTFIPHRCHDAIGVLGAVSVAAAARIPGTTAASVAVLDPEDATVVIEHPSGTFEATVEISVDDHGPEIHRAGIIRTARKLMDGTVFARSS